VDETSHTYFVPVRAAGHTAALVVKTGRLARGQRVGIAFTRPDRLIAAMGSGQTWLRLSLPALRTMLTPLGISGIQVDPILVAAAIAEPRADDRTDDRTDTRAAVAPAAAPGRAPVGAGVRRG
jgi:hypothetical protein